jgi:hypothetical protein
MSVSRNDRRKIYDLDYFLNGGIEKRKGAWCGYFIGDSGRANCSNYSYPTKLSHMDLKGGKVNSNRLDHKKITDQHFVWF